MATRKPVGQCGLSIHVPWQWIGFARADDRFQDRPNRIPVSFSNRFANPHRSILPRHPWPVLTSSFLRGYSAPFTPRIGPGTNCKILTLRSEERRVGKECRSGMLLDSYTHIIMTSTTTTNDK